MDYSSECKRVIQGVYTNYHLSPSEEIAYAQVLATLASTEAVTNALSDVAIAIKNLTAQVKANGEGWG